MSQTRPAVSPNLFAQLIDSAPDRVRRRLDRNPLVAADWTWSWKDDIWSIDTGGETVSLPSNHIGVMDRVGCTCLLSPNCFHVLACLATLEVTADEDAQTLSDDASADEESAAAPPVDDMTLSEKQIRALGELDARLGQLLAVGVANAGLVVQSGLLRAVHQCRAEALHRAASLGLRAVAGVQQFRARAAESDPAQLAQDIADCLETIRHLQGPAVDPFWIGTARRRQLPVSPRKLHGLFAEPVITDSGFAGAIVYLLGEDDQIYSASDVRPGEAQLARNAYRGGIDVGAMVKSARDLARGRYLGTDLTASCDGRLGKGKSVKIVEQGSSSWRSEAVLRRFHTSLLDQIERVYSNTALPADARPAGWDLLFITGEVAGALGPELLLNLSQGSYLRLAIANEHEALAFRENLRILSHAPGLQLQVIARLDLQQPLVAAALAVSPVNHDATDAEQPSLDLSENWSDRVCLGYDEIQRKFLLNAERRPVVLSSQSSAQVDDPLAAFGRRWTAMALSGVAHQRSGAQSSISTEINWLKQQGFPTAAALLNTVYLCEARNVTSSSDTFLASSLYLRSCRFALAEAAIRQTLT